GWVAGVERRDGVVRHLDLYLGTDEPNEDGAALLAIGRPIAAGAGEHDRLRDRAPKRFGQSRTDRSLRIRGGQQICAAARAPADHRAGAVHRESARLRSTGIDPHDDRTRHQGWWIAPPETARDAPVALGSVFGRPRRRYAPRIANATASRASTGMPSSSIVRTLSGATAVRRRSMRVSFFAPRPAAMPPSSKRRATASATRSLTILAGPVSNASTSSSRSVGMSVRLAIPPRFRSAIGARSAKRTKSANGTSGAPSPPAAMSAL